MVNNAPTGWCSPKPVTTATYAEGLSQFTTSTPPAARPVHLPVTANQPKCTTSTTKDNDSTSRHTTLSRPPSHCAVHRPNESSPPREPSNPTPLNPGHIKVSGKAGEPQIGSVSHRDHRCGCESFQASKKNWTGVVLHQVPAGVGVGPTTEPERRFSSVVGPTPCPVAARAAIARYWRCGNECGNENDDADGRDIERSGDARGVTGS